MKYSYLNHSLLCHIDSRLTAKQGEARPSQCRFLWTSVQSGQRPITQSPPSLLSSILLMTTSCCSLPSGGRRTWDTDKLLDVIPFAPKQHAVVRNGITEAELTVTAARASKPGRFSTE